MDVEKIWESFGFMTMTLKSAFTTKSCFWHTHVIFKDIMTATTFVKGNDDLTRQYVVLYMIDLLLERHKIVSPIHLHERLYSCMF